MNFYEKIKSECSKLGTLPQAIRAGTEDRYVDLVFEIRGQLEAELWNQLFQLTDSCRQIAKKNGAYISYASFSANLFTGKYTVCIYQYGVDGRKEGL